MEISVTDIKKVLKVILAFCLQDGITDGLTPAMCAEDIYEEMQKIGNISEGITLEEVKLICESDKGIGVFSTSNHFQEGSRMRYIIRNLADTVDESTIIP